MPAGRLLIPVLALIAIGGWAALRSGAGPGEGTARAASHSPATGPRSGNGGTGGAGGGGAPLMPGLSPGACLPFRPLRGDRHTTVFVDPGHGGVDPGAMGTTSSGTTVREKDITLAVGLDLLRGLREAGFEVVMSRTADTTVARLSGGDVNSGGLTVGAEHLDTKARVECANAAHAGLLIAVHMNAFDDPTVGGTETIYDSARSFSADNRRFATLIQQDIVASLSAQGWTVPDRGIKDDSALNPPALSVRAENYGHLLELGPAQAGWLDVGSGMPGALTEPLFVTDPNEASVAITARCQQAIAAGIEKAILGYFAAR